MTWRGTEVHLVDLVDLHAAKSAKWEYVEDTEHATKGVMHWLVTLYDAKIPIGERGWIRKTHVIKLANGANLLTDEYVTRLVIKELER
jgi:hypothetical protein